jgi:D-sedoheptulose 7-phosphate isomerase
MSLNCSDWISALGTALASVKCRCKDCPVDLETATEEVARLFRTVRHAGASIWLVGNGGSAAVCSHLSHDLVNKLAIRSHTLNDAALLTCMANDYGFDHGYLRPLQIMARPGDLVIAISSSGRSTNILSVADYAVSQGLGLITLSGFEEENPLWLHDAAVSFYLPSNLYGQVEIGHEALLHATIEAIWLEEKAGQ